MKLISRYSSEKPLYYAVFSPTEIHTFQTRSYDNIEVYNIMGSTAINQLYSENKA